jgi:glycosyltransferase involved in cell wall biosynthesis
MRRIFFVPGDAAMTEISIVIPVYNEEGSLQHLHASLKRMIESSAISAEIIFTDDCSTDGTAAVLAEIRRADPSVRVICLAEHAGQASALQAGFDHASAAVIVSLDADLENDPGDIPDLIKTLKKGYDAVCGRRTGRPRGMKRAVSRVGNGVFRLLFFAPVRDMACTLRAYRRTALDGMVLRGSLHRYLPVLLHLRGARLAEVEVRYVPREQGASKYGLFDRACSTLRDLFFLLFRRRTILYNTRREYVVREIW